MASGYHDLITAGFSKRVGAWELELGQLPDGRWAVDYYSDAAPSKTRHYFNTEELARAEYESFGRANTIRVVEVKL